MRDHLGIHGLGQQVYMEAGTIKRVQGEVFSTSSKTKKKKKSCVWSRGRRLELELEEVLEL